MKTTPGNARLSKVTLGSYIRRQNHKKTSHWRRAVDKRCVFSLHLILLRSARKVLHLLRYSPSGVCLKPSLIPPHGSKLLCLDVTVSCLLVDLQTASGPAGSVAELAATCKASKYSELDLHYMFQPVAVEFLGRMNDDTRKFLADLGRRISSVSSNR